MCPIYAGVGWGSPKVGQSPTVSIFFRARLSVSDSVSASVDVIVSVSLSVSFSVSVSISFSASVNIIRKEKIKHCGSF